MNLGAFTSVSSWQALDMLLMTSKSLFQPTPLSSALEHISNCLLDITLIAHRHFQLSLCKGYSLFCTLRLAPTSVFFYFIERYNYPPRCPNKMSRPHFQIFLSHPHLINHHVLQSLSQCLSRSVSKDQPTYTYTCMHTQSLPFSLVIMTRSSIHLPWKLDLCSHRISTQRKLGKINHQKIRKMDHLPGDFTANFNFLSLSLFFFWYVSEC